MLVVYGYARLVGYDRELRARARHPRELRGARTGASSRSSCARATAGPTASRSPPRTSATTGRTWRTTRSSRPPGRRSDLLVDGEPPKFEVLSDEPTVRYTWSKPNPHFLPRLAGASPLFIYRPAHYLKQFHKKYSEKVRKADAEGTAKRKLVGGAQPRRQPVRVRQPRPADAAAVDEHHAGRRPTASSPCAIPYFHRVDAERAGSCPTSTASCSRWPTPKLIPAKTGAGEADLQARDVHFNNYTFLKQGEKQQRLPHAAVAAGQGLALRAVPEPERRTTRCGARCCATCASAARCRSRSTARSINQVLYFGLAIERNNTVLPQSPLFREAYRDALGAATTRRQAAQLLDEMGLKRGPRRHAPAARRPAARDHRRDRGREHRADRRARADPRDLARGRHQAVQQAVAARGVPQPRLLRRDA